MARAFCSQLRQYVKQLVTNPQPCLVSQTARLHVGDARNRFYSLLHSWGSDKPIEPAKRQPAGSLPLVLTVDELKLVVLREDVALPLRPARLSNAIPRAAPFPEPPRNEGHQKAISKRSKPSKPNYANPDPERSNKPTPELETSPRAKPAQSSPAHPRDRRPPAKPTGIYPAPVKFYFVKPPVPKMNEPLDLTRRSYHSAASRNLSLLAANSITKGRLVEAVKNSQIKGFHASAENNKNKRDRDRDRSRDRDKERRRERNRARSGDGDAEMRRDDEEREGRTICAGKMPEPTCEEICSQRRGSGARRSSVREPEYHEEASVRESEHQRGASVQEPEWRRRASMREPNSRRGAAAMKEPRNKCSGNEPWKGECPGANRLRKCPGGSCGRGRDPSRKSFSSHALQSGTNIPILNNLKSSKSEVARWIGFSDVIFGKKKGSCDDKYSMIKDKKKRMKLMEKELDEIRNCIESVKCKLRRSPKEEKGSDKKS